MIISEATRPALRRPDEPSDLVASHVREVDDLSTRSSVGAVFPTLSIGARDPLLRWNRLARTNVAT
jgi:hypothetical protein